MKCLTLFVHKSVQSEVVDSLRSAPEVTGFTLIECEGHSTSTEADVFQAARDLVVGFVPRLRIDVILDDAAVEPVLERLRRSSAEANLAGAWLITEVASFGRL